MKKPIIFLNTLNSKNCKIYSLWKILDKQNKAFFFLNKTPYRCCINEKSFRKQTELHSEKRLKRNIDHIIVFGVKDDDFPVLKTVSANSFIDKNWFDVNIAPCVALFFVPKGAQMLRHEHWFGKFDQWVSCEYNFDFMIGLDITEDAMQKVFKKILKINYKHKTSESIKNELVRIFDDIIHYYSKNEKEDFDEVILTVYKLRVNKMNLTSA